MKVFLVSTLVVVLYLAEVYGGDCFAPCVNKKPGRPCPTCPAGPNCFAHDNVIRADQGWVKFNDNQECRCALEGEAGYEEHGSFCRVIGS